MRKLTPDSIESITQSVQSGQVIAYPTEAVFGLGCDPDNESAALKILELKQRPVEKGMILIASTYSQVAKYVNDELIPFERRPEIFSSWPGPVTWLLPKSAAAPAWITGESEFIAVRVTNHPTVRSLCNALDAPLVSTSANPAGDEPATSASEVAAYFGDDLIIIDEKLGEQAKPSQIKHSMTGQVLRN